MKKTILILTTVLTLLSSCNTKKEVVQLVGEFEDSVRLVQPNTEAKDSDYQRINVYFKSKDLTYKISIAKRLLIYLPDIHGEYKFNWHRYELKELNSKNSKVRELHCWDSLTDASGKILIFDGYDVFKVGDINPYCEVPVEITETII